MTLQNIRLTDLSAHVGKQVTVHAWVTHLRSSGKIAFAVLRDGSGVAQAVIAKTQVTPEVWTAFQALTLETSVRVTGVARPEPRAPGGFDITVTELAVVGDSPLDYPI